MSANAKSMTMAQAKERIHELKIVQEELKSLKKKQAVYQVQRNSDVMFKVDQRDMFSSSKKELDDLIKEYGDLDKEDTKTLS